MFSSRDAPPARTPDSPAVKSGLDLETEDRHDQGNQKPKRDEAQEAAKDVDGYFPTADYDLKVG